MRKLFIIISLLISTAGILINPTRSTAEVYKHVDDKGNVTYSDAPQKKGDQPISLPEPTTIKITPAPKSGTSASHKKPPSQKAFEYDSVAIISPNNDEAIRSNSGDITIQISSSPSLQTGHLYAVIVDGAKKLDSAAASVTLTNLDRGTHTAKIEIHNDQGQTIASSAPVSFHILRQSVH